MQPEVVSEGSSEAWGGCMRKVHLRRLQQAFSHHRTHVTYLFVCLWDFKPCLFHAKAKDQGGLHSFQTDTSIHIWRSSDVPNLWTNCTSLDAVDAAILAPALATPNREYTLDTSMVTIIVSNSKK